MVYDFNCFSKQSAQKLLDEQLNDHWLKQLVVFQKQTVMPLMAEFLKRIDARDVRSLAAAFKQDAWGGALEAIDYFYNCFEVKLPLEVFCDTTSAQPEIYYEHLYDWENGAIFTSEIIISERALLLERIFPLFAHEVWHAKQHQLVLEWFSRHGLKVDLDKIDPAANESRGLLYLIQSYSYVSAVESPHYYRHQLLEYESILVEKEVAKYCS